MVATLESMGRKKKPPTTHIRMRVDLAEMLEIVAAQRKKDLPELLDELFRAAIHKEYNFSVEQLNKTIKKMKQPD